MKPLESTVEFRYSYFEEYALFLVPQFWDLEEEGEKNLDNANWRKKQENTYL